MSTRSHIIVRESDKAPMSEWSYIYHHCDGYPEGVGREIGCAFEENIRPNSIGKKYTLDEICAMITNIEDEYRPDKCLHGDEEYIYVVTLEADKEGVVLDCYATLPFSFNSYAEKFTMDAGYEFIFQSVYRNSTALIPSDEKKEETYFEKYRANLHGFSNATLVDMMRMICDELASREIK